MMKTNYVPSTYPDAFPEVWASGWGDDEYGLWMTFTYRGNSCRFTWLSATDDEALKSMSENSRVNGCWVGERISQALWDAMMDTPFDVNAMDLPRFKAFIDRIHSLKPEFRFHVPAQADDFLLRMFR